jgi:hypothetical protein
MRRLTAWRHARAVASQNGVSLGLCSTGAVEVSATLRGMTSLIGYARVSSADQDPAL